MHRRIARHGRVGAVAPLGAFLLVIAAGCVDEEIVYRDRPLYDDPLDAAASFLGYTDHETKLTVCGNCHVEKQADWEGTGHAVAWAGLQTSPAAQAVCEGCHTVGQLGNTIADVAGYEATGEIRYEDVQCESCHGPGLTHVTNPTDETVPLPPLAVGLDLTLGCGECHSDTHHPFVEEWSQSRHGTMNAYPQGRAECESCHTGEGALETVMGVRTAYLEQADVEDNTASNLPITCAVCHDPHSNAIEGQLRFPVNVADVDQNLCMKCHQKRAVPDPGTTSRGPHSPQGPLLLGEDVGWIPPNFAYQDQRIRGTHGSERNERLCAGCHVNSFEVTDPESGSHLFTATGHLFKPVPCLGENGIPTADDSCAWNTTERSWASCTTSGCHGDAGAALSALLLARGRIDPLVEELDALLALVPQTEFSTTDTIFTVAEGARFNQGLGEIGSSAVHNPFLTEALLKGSIQAVEDEYGVVAPTSGADGSTEPRGN